MLDPKTGGANFATKFEFPSKDETDRQRRGVRAVAGDVRKWQQAGGWMEGFLQQSEASGDRSAWRIPRVEPATDNQLAFARLLPVVSSICGNQSHHR